MNKTLEENLRDTQHNKKLKEILFKLLAKQKSTRRDWSDVRAETYPITKEIKPGVDDEIKSIHWVTK